MAEPNKSTVASTHRSRPRRTAMRVLALLTALALAVGTGLVLYQCLAFTDGESWGLAIGPGWVLVMLVVLLLGGSALVAANRAGWTAVWFGLCALSSLGLWNLVPLLQARFAPIPSLVLALAVLDASLLGGGWLLVFFQPRKSH